VLAAFELKIHEGVVELKFKINLSGLTVKDIITQFTNRAKVNTVILHVTSFQPTSNWPECHSSRVNFS